MGILTVYHWGLGVWIEREDCYEVLFPRAEGVQHPIDTEKFLEAHDPILHVAPENLVKSTKFEPDSAFDLRGCLLDLTGLDSTFSGAPLSPAFLIGLVAEWGSVANSKEPPSCDLHGDDLVGRMRVPKGVVFPAEQIEGPIEFDGRLGLVTSSRVGLSFPLKFDSAEEQSFEARITNEITGVTRTVKMKPDAAGTIALMIQNLSVADRQPAAELRKPRNSDHDFAAHYRLITREREHPNKKKGKPVPVPGYEGTEFGAFVAAPNTGAAMTSWTSKRQNPPFQICTACYAVPEPQPVDSDEGDCGT